jgi:hypothetical protein
LKSSANKHTVVTLETVITVISDNVTLETMEGVHMVRSPDGAVSSVVTYATLHIQAFPPERSWDDRPGRNSMQSFPHPADVGNPTN